MRHRYGYLDPDLIRRLLAEMGLRRLFNHVLLQTGGDVEEAMRWMKALQERGFIDPDVDLEAFFARLVEENIIGQAWVAYWPFDVFGFVNNKVLKPHAP